MDVRRSLLLSFFEKYFTVGINFTSVVVIARLVTPDEIGLYSVAAALINVAQMLRDFGVAGFLLQEKELTRDHMATAFSISLLSGCLFAAAFAGGAEWIADYYHDPRLAPLVMFLSVNFVVVSQAAISTSLLRRHMMFTAIARVGIAQSVANVSVSIAATAMGYGPLGLAWGATAGMIANVVVGQMHLPAGTMTWPGFKEWRRLMAYGAAASGGQVLVGLGQRLPDIVIGRVLGFTAAGFYSRGCSFITLFNQTVLHAVWPVTVSALAALHREGKDLSQPFLKSFALLTCVAWPMLGALALVAPSIMLLAFGDQWMPAVPVARVLCLAAAVAIPNALSFSLTSAIGNVRLHMKAQAILLPVQFVLLILAARQGFEAAAWAAVAVETLQMILYGNASLAKIGATWGQMATACRASVAVGLAALCPSLAVTWLRGFSTPLGWLELAGVGVATGAVWLAANFVFRHPLRHELTLAVRQLRGTLARVGAA
jgi:O-antigen/teichoic acid export membrane protein